MVNCGVFSCKRRSVTSNLSEHGISYHRFPKDPTLREKWREFCGQKQTWIPTRTSVICSEHFEARNFQVLCNNRRKLLEDAVPTLSRCHCAGNADGTPSSCSKTSNKKRKIEDNNSECNDDDIEDNYDVWAKECAIELRQMDPVQQIFAKRAITYILMEGRLGLLNSNSVHINNKIPCEDTAHKDSNVSVLDEFLVMRKGSGESSSVAVSQESGGSSVSTLSLADTEPVSRAASHKTGTRPSRVRSKPSNKTTASACQQTTTSVDALSFDNGGSKLVVKTKAFDDPGSSLVIGSHKITTSDSSTTAFVKLEPFDDTGTSPDELTTPVDSSTSFVKSEPCDDIESTSIIASHEIAAPVRRSSHMTSEPNSPPSSPDFTTVVIKSEDE